MPAHHQDSLYVQSSLGTMKGLRMYVGQLTVIASLGQRLRLNVSTEAVPCRIRREGIWGVHTAS